MVIYLDGQQVQLGGEDLATVLGAAKQQLADSGRVIVEVAVDGKTLTDDELGSQVHRAVGSGELRLYTANPNDLVRSTLELLLGQLDKARQYQSDAAERLHRDERNEAMSLISRAMDVWLQTQQAVVHSVSMTDIDIETMDVDGLLGKVLIDQLIDQLKSLRDMIEFGDSVALADALAYEWPQIADRWQKLLLKIIEQVDQ